MYERCMAITCPEDKCKCMKPPRNGPLSVGRRNPQQNGYCYHFCGTTGYCQVTTDSIKNGQDCRGCRKIIDGY